MSDKNYISLMRIPREVCKECCGELTFKTEEGRNVHI